MLSFLLRTNFRIFLKVAAVLVIAAITLTKSNVLAAIPNSVNPSKSLQPNKIEIEKLEKPLSQKTLSLKEKLQARILENKNASASTLVFDLPVTYNRKVSYWINHFQTKGKSWFTDWLERSSRYMPLIQNELTQYGLPNDLVYMAMVESGFNINARSHAEAVGPWQFIQETGQRYGLHVNPWLDERRDIKKATIAAVRYIRDLYKEFGSWYLVAASYNMGENGLRRQIQKYQTRDFWALSRMGALPQETMDYVPKIIAAMLIAKSPGLYGFKNLTQYEPLEYDLISMPGGTDLNRLADHIGVTRKFLKDLNAELVLGYIPSKISKHILRVPRGSVSVAASFAENEQR